MKKIIITAIAAVSLCLTACISDKTHDMQQAQREAGRAVQKAERKL